MKRLLKYSIITSIVSYGIYCSFKLENPHYKIIIVGLLSQVTTDYIFHPIELLNVRTKYYYQQNLTTLTTFRRILSTTGVTGLFRGGSVTLMGSSISGSIYLPFYINIRDYIKNKFHGNEKFFLIAYTTSSVISQFLYYIICYPFELIKTRIQTGQYNYRNFFDGIYKIYKNDNDKLIKAIYQGFTPAIILNATTMMFVFLIFELTRDFIGKRRNINSSEVEGLDYFICSFTAGFFSATILNFLEVYTIQRMVNGSSITLTEFLKGKNIRKIMTSGLLTRNLNGIFYVVFYFEFIKIYSRLYKVKL